MEITALRNRLKYYHGIWLMVILLSIVSVLTSYSLTGQLMQPLLQQVAGLGAIYAFSKVSYKKYNRSSILFLVVAFVLLVLTLIMRRGAGGRSISIGGHLIQTFYIVSLCLIFYLCIFFAKHTNKGKEIDKYQSIWGIGWLMLFVGLIALRNISTAIILFITGMTVMFVAGVKFKYLFYTFLLCGALGGIYLAIGHYRNQKEVEIVQGREDRSTTLDSRIQYWLHGKCDSKAYGRQMTLSKAAISRSIVNPSGPGKGLIKKNMAEGENDFIFALICEEFTLATGLAVLIIYVILFYQALFVARKARGNFIRYYATGIGMLILMQALIHIGANTGVIPATGQTLPLISRGSVSLFFTCFALGTLINMAKQVIEQTDGEDEELMV